MAPLRTIILPAFAAAVAAQNIADFVPECGTGCIETTIDESTHCDAGDAACLCENNYNVKRNAERCLRDECSESDYGLVMTGYDEFCDNAGGAEPEPTEVPTTTSTGEGSYPTEAPPESDYPTEPPAESEYPTEAPPESEYPTTSQPPESGYPTEAPPESEYPTEVPTVEPPEVPSSIIETFPTITDQPPPTGEPEYPTEAPPTPTEEPEYPTEAPPEPTDYPTEAPPEPTDYPTEAPQPPPGNTTFSTGYPTEEPPTPTDQPESPPIETAAAPANFQLGSGAFVAAGLFAAGLAVFGF